MPIVDKHSWDEFILKYPNAHILQTSSWGDLKRAHGWDVTRVALENVGAQLLFRHLPIGYTVGYIGKGPLGKPGEEFWNAVDGICHAKRAIFLKVEPDEWLDGKTAEVVMESDGFQKSSHSIQPPRTILVNIEGEEAGILAKMKQKTRYNIRLAIKRGVVVRRSSNVKIFHEILLETGKRDEFGIHSFDYYQQCYDLFNPLGECELLLAEYMEEIVGGVMVFAHGNRAWYLYGASSDRYRNTMTSYLLQWEAIRWARSRGCVYYDLWGVPDEDEEILESGFSQRNDGLWGVYRFKRGFGGSLFRSSGPWDRIYHPMPYRLYGWWIKYKNE